MEIMVTQLEGAEHPGGKSLRISGRGTVSGAAELQRALVAALDSAQELVLDVGAVTDCDPTFFQLLCAACRSAAARGGRVRVAPAGLETLRGLAAANGFHPAGGRCRQQGSCLLQKEEEI